MSTFTILMSITHIERIPNLDLAASKTVTLAPAQKFFRKSDRITNT